MINKKSRIRQLTVAISLAIALGLTSPALANPINWTGNAQFSRPPQALDINGMPARGIFALAGIPGTGGPTLRNLDDGFEYTDVRLEYTSVAADANMIVFIQWRIERPFDEPDGTYITGSDLNGSLTLPANSRASFRLSTFEDGVNASEAVAEGGPFQTGIMGQMFNINGTGSIAYQHKRKDRPTELHQIFTMAFMPSAANQVFKLELPGSA